MGDAEMLLLKLKWATASPFGRSRPDGVSDRSTAVLKSVKIVFLVQTETKMAKTISTKRRTSEERRRVASRRAGWVRKNVAMDQHKLDVARRALGVDTETEAIDQALDLVVFSEELAKGFTAVRRSGGVDDVRERRRRA
jgi:hypothetical protein